MKSKRIINAIGDISDKYIEEAEPIGADEYSPVTKRKSVRVRRYAGLAACLVVCIALGIAAGSGLLNPAGGPAGQGDSSITADGGATDDAVSDAPDQSGIDDVNHPADTDGNIIAVPQAAYGIIIGNRVYFPIGFDERKAYGLVSPEDIGLTPENTYEIGDADLGEPFGVIDSSLNSSLVGKTAYHFAKFPDDDDICIVEIYNPAPASEAGLVQVTDEYTDERYGFYVFSHIDPAASHALFADYMSEQGITVDKITKIYRYKIVGDDSKSELVKDGEIDAALAPEIFKILGNKPSLNKFESDRLYVDLWKAAYGNNDDVYFDHAGNITYTAPTPKEAHAVYEKAQALWDDGQIVFEFATPGMSVSWTFKPSVRVVTGGDSFYQLTEKEAKRLGDLLAGD